MHVKYFADVRRLSGCFEEDWTQPAATLGELVKGLAGRHGPAFEERVQPAGRLSGTIIVLINGQNIVHLEGLASRLDPGDTVAFFPMVAGG